MIQTFSKCPFCQRTFDVLAEDATELRVDGVRRYAHAACAERLTKPAPEPTKGNGELPNGTHI